MISAHNYKIIQIDITTFRSRKNMNEEKYSDRRYCRDDHNRFICSICLNKKPSNEEDTNIECHKRKSRSCPVCQRSYDIDEYAESIAKKESCTNTNNDNKDKCETCHKDSGKKVQTSLPDVSHGLSLLNEVLTVFQNKKMERKHENHKTIILKDACVSTEYFPKQSSVQLTVSKVFHYSIEENSLNIENKFTVLNCQPENINNSLSVDLIKHKSSSIPQMKLEELKKSLKDKTKSKDAIEEVNRMFATVRKIEASDSLEDCNRPMVRNGPRVLPVVKTDYHESENNARNGTERCRCYYHMSGGDSIEKQDCLHKTDNRCDDCVRSSYCRRVHRPICDNCRTYRTERQ